jgi:hypothetical protein
MSISKQGGKEWSTVAPKFTNLVCSWRHKTQWNSREGTANSNRDVYWAEVTQQLMLYRQYSQLVTNHCCRLVCSLLKTPFVTRDVHLSENLFMNPFVRDERLSWTAVPQCIIWRVPSRCASDSCKQ